MTTIITKNGSGAPTAGQLSEGELAVDLTNKELYTKSGSTVIKIGAQGGSTGTFTDLTATSSFTSPGIDDNATSTAITIDSSEDVGIGTTTPDTILHLKDSIPILTMEHDAGQSARLYFEDATDGGWGGIKARYASGGSVKEIAIAPASATGDARYGGLSVTPTKATIGGDFQQTNLDVLGQVSIEGTYPALDSRTPGQLGSRLVTTGNNMLMSNLTSSGTYASDIYKVGLSETGPTRHTWTTASAGSAMVLLDGGNLGIGTTAPQTKLHVTQSAEDGSDGIRLSRSNGLGTFTQWVSGASSWSLGYSNPATADPTTATLTVMNTGAVVIGKTDASTNVNGVQFDTLTGCGRIITSKSETGTRDSLMNYHNFTYVGGVRYTDTATSFPTSSDERLKDNIVDAPAGNIDDLKVRSFDWKSNGEHQEYGFVAQELEPVAPYAVSSCGTEDAMLAVDYSKLVPMLVKEIQDLKAEVAALKGA